jgi:hypothetical protein
VRRTLVFAAAIAVPVSALVVATACDQAGSLVGATDSGRPEASLVEAGPPQDAGTADAVEELVVADVCGPGPWVTLGITVIALDLTNPNGSPLPGAQFTSPLCPGLMKVSDPSGSIVGQVSQDVAFYARLQATNYIPELAPEMIFDADSTGTHIEMLPTLLEGIVPGFGPDASAILIAAVDTIDDAGACSSLDGITFNVPGQSGAKVTYFSADTIPAPIADASATSTRGLAAITGVTGGGFVTLSASKPGCNVVFARGPLTGRLPLENGFASVTPAYLTP